MNTPLEQKQAPAVAGSLPHPGAPLQPSSRSHLVDTASLLVYFVAIGLVALFLDVPYPWLLAAAIALACLLAIGTRWTSIGGST